MINFLYFFLFFASFLDLLKNKSPIILELLLFILFITTAFQYGTDDYDSYNYIFNVQSFEYISYPFFNNPYLGLSGQEFLFSSLICSVKYLGLSYQNFVFLFFFIIYLIKRKVFKSLRYPLISLFVVTVLILNKELSQWRHAMVINISLLILYDWKKNKSLIYPLIGFSFHSLSLISLIPAFIIRFVKQQNIIKYSIFGVIFLFNLLLLANYFSDFLQLSSKLNSTVTSYEISNNYYYLSLLIIIITSFCFYQKNFNYLIGLIVLIMGLSFMFMFSFNPTLSGRTTEIFFPLSILILINNKFSLSGNYNAFKVTLFNLFFLTIFITRDLL